MNMCDARYYLERLTGYKDLSLDEVDMALKLIGLMVMDVCVQMNDEKVRIVSKSVLNHGDGKVARFTISEQVAAACKWSLNKQRELAKKELKPK